ncbi:MAG: DoxX family protein [Halobacteriaceae archaeon]
MDPRAGRLVGAVVGTAAAVAAVGTATAHVDYVTEGGGHRDPLAFFIDVVTDPFNAALLAGGGVSVLLAALLYLRVRPLSYDVAVFRRVMGDYDDLLPWLLRLSFGLPMVGAGFAGYFFSPEVAPVLPLFSVSSRLFQIGVGFALLFGIATRLVAFLALGAYLTSVLFTPVLVLSNEYVTGLLTIMLLGSGRPSADHVLQRIASAPRTTYGRIDPVQDLAEWFNEQVDPYEQYAPTVVRVGLGLNFIFLGFYEKLLRPGVALQVVEKYDLTAVVPVDPGLWVVGAGLTEAALGTALVVGAFTRASSLVALFMFTLTLFGLPDDPVLAHVTLFGLASMLLVTGSGPYALDRRIREWS